MAEAGLEAMPAAGAATDAADRTYRKILWRIMPVLVLLWVCAWLDRTNVSLAKLQMASELGLDDAAYGFGAGIFFLGYMLCQVPSNLVLLKIGVRRTLSIIAIGWGATSILMMFMRTPAEFYGLRFVLGAFEGGLYPGGLLYLTMMLPTARRGRAIALFTCAGAVSGIVGGPLAGTLMTRCDGVNGWAGWQWLFLVEGALSVVLGVAALLVLADGLAGARWLRPEERAAVAADLARDDAALGERQDSIWTALRNPMLWLLCSFYVCNNSGYTSLSFWGPTMIQEAGIADPARIGWILSGLSVASAVAMYLAGLAADRARSAPGLFALMMLASGAGMAWLGSLGGAAAAIGGLCWTLAAAACGVVVFWHMPNRVFSGTAIAVAIGLISGLSNIGAFFAPTALGAVKQATGSLAPGLWALGAAYAAVAAATWLFVHRTRGPAARPL